MKKAKEGGMAGKLGWVLGLALAWTGVRDLGAQPPVSADGPEMLKAPAPATGAWPAASSAAVLPSVYEPVPVRVYVSADYLLLWMRRGPLPEQPLVTTGPPNAANAGIVFQPGTQTLFGGPNGLEWHGFSGARLTAGVNFSEDSAWGLEASGFLLPRQTINFNAASTGPGTPVITRPIFNNLEHVEAAYDISSSDAVLGPLVSGRVSIQATTELWGYELNLTHHRLAASGANLALSFGFRSLGLDEKLQIQSDIHPEQAGVVTFLGAPVNNTTDHVTTNDFFGTRNRYYGPQAGCGFNWQWDRLGANLIGKIGAGVNHQSVTISGESTLVQNGVVADVAPGGILAQRTNIGAYTRDVFCLVPEFDLTLTYDVTSWLRARFSYNLLYWSSVVRPGKQIDRNIDITQVPTDQMFGATFGGMPFPAARPAFSFRDSDFWAQGLSFGLEIRY